MAEVVGVVVGVVSLGVQLAESLKKVKRFYDTVREAPERLSDIIDEIGSLSDILTELEQDPPRVVGAPALPCNAVSLHVEKQLIDFPPWPIR